ncbi:hypothetical protein D3C87_1368180 [compost metagenome]
MLDVLASSRASPLPQVQWLYAKSANYPNHCGSGLAREGGVSGNVDAGCAGLFASRLAPTGSVAVCKICELAKSLWERACSRWRRVWRHGCWMYRPHREQARSHSFFVLCQTRRARAPMAMNSAAIARASCSSPRATSSGICARGTRRHSRGSGSSPCSWQGLSCSASTTR